MYNLYGSGVPSKRYGSHRKRGLAQSVLVIKLAFGNENSQAWYISKMKVMVVLGTQS